jgi:ribosomal-protein-alanine acetyltransferase
MAGVDLRRGIAADVGALRAIETSVFDHEQLTARSFRRYLGLPAADVVVAEDAGKAIGYAITSFPSGSRGGRLISIAVATRASGRGVGTAMLATLHRLAIARGMAAIRLEVRRDNLAGLSLYGRMGYTQIGVRPGYYADFCDAIVMQVALSGA